MITQNMVTKWATTRLNNMKTLDHEILEAIRNGDQFRNMIKGLTGLLQDTARTVELRRGRPLKMSTIIETIDDFTDQFVKAFKYDATLRNESDLDRIQREQKIQEKKDLESTIEGNSQGVYEELGVEIDDRTEETTD